MKVRKIREILRKNKDIVLIDGMETKLNSSLLSNEEDFVLVDGDESYAFTCVNCERENEFYFFRYQLEDQYFEWTGNYDSWGGITLDSTSNVEEVRPVQKTITVWKIL